MSATPNGSKGYTPGVQEPDLTPVVFKPSRILVIEISSSERYGCFRRRCKGGGERWGCGWLTREGSRSSNRSDRLVLQVVGKLRNDVRTRLQAVLPVLEGISGDRKWGTLRLRLIERVPDRENFLKILTSIF